MSVYKIKTGERGFEHVLIAMLKCPRYPELSESSPGSVSNFGGEVRGWMLGLE